MIEAGATDGPRQVSSAPRGPLRAGEVGVACDARFIIEHKGEKAGAIIY